MVQRVDPDYNPSKDEIESIARFITHAAHHLPQQVLYKTGNGNGFQKWVLGLMMALVVLGVGGIAGVEYNSVQRVAALEAQRAADEKRLSSIEAKIDKLLMRQ